jgi:hypothetical protein
VKGLVMRWGCGIPMRLGADVGVQSVERTAFRQQFDSPSERAPWRAADMAST